MENNDPPDDCCKTKYEVCVCKLVPTNFSPEYHDIHSSINLHEGCVCSSYCNPAHFVAVQSNGRDFNPSGGLSQRNTVYIRFLRVFSKPDAAAHEVAEHRVHSQGCVLHWSGRSSSSAPCPRASEEPRWTSAGWRETETVLGDGEMRLFWDYLEFSERFIGV